MNNMVTSVSKRVSTHYGASGTVTGRLHWDPLVYPNRDGSKMYFFQVDTVSCSGNPNNTQVQNFARMKAYVPSRNEARSPCARLHQGSMVTVQYVVRTDTYYNASGELKSNTYLSVRNLSLHDERKTPSLQSSRNRPSFFQKRHRLLRLRRSRQSNQ